MKVSKQEATLLAKKQIVIDSLVIQIEHEFKCLLNLYMTLTNAISGKRYTVYDNSVFNYKDYIKFKNLDIVVKPHGFSRSCFITYRKGWFKTKEFYHSMCYEFHTEYDKDTRYNFTVEDYKIILQDLKEATASLEKEIDNEH